MKQSRVFLALGFFGLIILIALGVWLSQLLFGATSDGPSTDTPSVFETLFPFGRSGSSVVTTEESVGSDVTGPVPRLRKVSDARVAGAQFTIGITGIPSIRYVERETGHIYETPVDALTSLRLTNTTIPRVHKAVWVSASTTVFRFSDTDTTETFMGSLSGTSTDAELVGGFIDPYVQIATDGTYIAGVLVENDGARIVRLDPKTLTDRTEAISPLTSWVPHAAAGSVFVASAPSGRALGALYRVENGIFSRVVGGVQGLEALLSPESRILVSSGGINALRLAVLSGTQLVTLPHNTLVDKCAWMSTLVLCGVPQTIPGGLYPDDWHLGRVHTDDALWVIDTETGTSIAVLDPEEESGVSMDITDVRVSDDGRYATFINKNDLTLWSVALTPQ